MSTLIPRGSFRSLRTGQQSHRARIRRTAKRLEIRKVPPSKPSTCDTRSGTFFFDVFFFIASCNLLNNTVNYWFLVFSLLVFLVNSFLVSSLISVVDEWRRHNPKNIFQNRPTVVSWTVFAPWFLIRPTTNSTRVCKGGESVFCPSLHTQKKKMLYFPPKNETVLRVINTTLLFCRGSYSENDFLVDKCLCKTPPLDTFWLSVISSRPNHTVVVLRFWRFDVS